MLFDIIKGNMEEPKGDLITYTKVKNKGKTELVAVYTTNDILLWEKL